MRNSGCEGERERRETGQERGQEGTIECSRERVIELEKGVERCVHIPMETEPFHRNMHVFMCVMYM